MIVLLAAETTFYGLRESTASERERAIARVRREAAEDVKRSARAAARAGDRADHVATTVA